MTTPQVLITQSAQAVVEVAAADPAVVEVLAPSTPITVEVEVRGPQGPARLPDALRIDTSTSGVVFTGHALHGTPESASSWIITRSTYSPAGIRLTKKAATGVTWTGRNSHTYS